MWLRSLIAVVLLHNTTDEGTVLCLYDANVHQQHCRFAELQLQEIISDNNVQ